MKPKEPTARRPKSRPGFFEDWPKKRRLIKKAQTTAFIIIAVIIGVFTGLVFNFDPRLSLLAGYAGTDILEGIYN